MGVNKTEPPEACTADALCGQGRYLDPVSLAHDHILDESPAVDKDTNLPSHFAGELHQVPGPFRGDDLGCLYLLLVKAEEPPPDQMVKALCVAVYVYETPPRKNRFKF